jgi:uncharacterized protein YjaZ
MKDASKKSTASTTAKIFKEAPNKQSRAVAVSKRHNHLALCSNLGKVSIRSMEDFDKKLQTLKDAKHWSEVAKYSPNEDFLAVGAHDQVLYIYKIDADTH